MSKRVAVYARVSTTKQAESDISIPDQLSQARRYCSERGWVVVTEFVDPGASARDDKRPEFQHLMDAACRDPSPFDVVLVHSQSRFFRDTAGYVVSKRKLQKHAVSLVSMTQDFGEGAAAEFAETVIAASDALNSAETSKHVTRTMLENARQGFWNGSLPPYGYHTVAVEQRGQRIKKRLIIEEREAATVRQIFKLCLEGDGTKGPMGVREIAYWLNAYGLRNRNGKLFFVSLVHAILTRNSYTGTHYYNTQDSRTGHPRDKSEWIGVPVPEIIPRDTFNRVQEILKERRPDITAPRITNSEVLLTGLIRCESCGGPMMLCTGTGRSGRVYRYYACAGRQHHGRLACGRPVSVPEAQLDELVLKALADQLLTPTRLPELLIAAIQHRRQTTSEARAQKATLERQRKEIGTQIDRLITAVAEGVLPDMSQIRAKIDDLTARREECVRLLTQIESAAPEFRQALSKQQATSIADTLKRRLLNAPPALKKRYLRGLVSGIVVGAEKAVISGPPAAIAAAVTAPERLGEVRGFVREWCPRPDLNQHAREGNRF